MHERPTTMRRILSTLLLVAAVASCGDEVGQSPDQEAGPVWLELPDFPLAERSGPVVAWTGSEVLAVGGDIGDECPPNADCQYPNEAAKDGAALDLSTREWRTIASAPVPIPAYVGGTMVAGRLFVLVGGTLVSYDPERDHWSTVRRDLSNWYSLAPDGDRLLLVSSSDENGTRPDLVHDPRHDRWTELPADPLGRSYDRSITATPAGLVLAGKKVVPNPGGGADPSYVEAALLDRRTDRWRTFGPSGLLGGSTWTTVGTEVVSLALGSSDGGGDPPGDYGRDIPYGGTLDVSTRVWAPLVNAPEPMSGGWGVYAASDRLIASEGYVFDPAVDTWIRVPRPDGAAERPGPAVWAGETLVVITQETSAEEYDEIRDNGSWAWTPVTAAQ